MSKVTSKFQVTIPRAVARAHGIGPGTDLRFESAGDAIRVRINDPTEVPSLDDRERRLYLFDQATARQEERNGSEGAGRADDGRGWTRDELYDRGLPR